MVLTTLRLNPKHWAVQRELRDVCAMHSRVIDATVGMAEGAGRVLWAQPLPDTVVIRAAEPVTPARLPAGYAIASIHRPWVPPQPGPHRAVMVVSPVRKHQVTTNGVRRHVADPIKDRGEQMEWLTAWLAPYLTHLRVDVTREWNHKGAHRHGHTIVHKLITVRLTGVVTDAGTLAAHATKGMGKARAYGGGLSIWQAAA